MIDQYGWRAFVQHDFGMWCGVAVHLGRFHDGELREVARPVAIEADQTEPGVYSEREPFLRLPEDVARALLDALAAHYGGTSDVRQARADLDHERKRVDKLIDRMTGGAA